MRNKRLNICKQHGTMVHKLPDGFTLVMFEFGLEGKKLQWYVHESDYQIFLT